MNKKFTRTLAALAMASALAGAGMASTAFADTCVVSAATPTAGRYLDVNGVKGVFFSGVQIQLITNGHQYNVQAFELTTPVKGGFASQVSQQTPCQTGQFLGTNPVSGWPFSDAEANAIGGLVNYTDKNENYGAILAAREVDISQMIALNEISGTELHQRVRVFRFAASFLTNPPPPTTVTPTLVQLMINGSPVILAVPESVPPPTNPYNS